MIFSCPITSTVQKPFHKAKLNSKPGINDKYSHICWFYSPDAKLLRKILCANKLFIFISLHYANVVILDKFAGLYVPNKKLTARNNVER